jgi:UDP-N-acetylmuramate--alanine ligase
MGIGGSGASAIASIAKAYGFEVTGCDINPHTEFTTGFDKSQLFTGHSPDHIQEVDILAFTPAVLSLDPNNLEIKTARALGKEVLTWQQFMGKYLTEGKFVIAVCGTHGKSTTTAMIGVLLEEAGLDPTVELGAMVNRWGRNYRIGKSKYFVTESDEFNDNFLSTHPTISVITNVEMDHPEYFKDIQAVEESFAKFISFTSDVVVANLEDRGVREVLVKADQERVQDYSKSLIDFPLKIPGVFNIYNASAAREVGKILGISEDKIKSSLENFKGLARRFEFLGEKTGGVKVYSDFAHHPTELLATSLAVRNQYPHNKIWVIFQPHMFSRTYSLFNQFLDTFKKMPVDEIVVTDIYPSREVDTGLVNSQQLATALNKHNITYAPSKEDLFSKLNSQMRPNDVMFFMGAGDIDNMAREYAKSN